MVSNDAWQARIEAELKRLQARTPDGESLFDQLARLQPGETCEVHVSEGETAPQGVTTAGRFVDCWQHPGAQFGTPDPTGRYLGIIHDAGALLIRLD
jgi:hypothetical protein